MESTVQSKTRIMTTTALMAALLCILAPLSVPVGPVPISLATAAIYFAAYVLGSRLAAASCLIYLLLGLAGIPVFSGFSAGPAKLLGPTGGYLIGYLLLAFISGLFIEHFSSRVLQVLGMILATAVLYLFGTCWLAFQSGLSFSAALAAGVLPFLIGDALKIALAALAGPVIRRAVLRSQL